MTPTEIQQLKKESPALQEALSKQGKTVYAFLREHVSAQDVLPCEKCKRRMKLFRSLYAWDLCIECLLVEMEIPLENPYSDPRSRQYDAEYAAAFNNPGCYAWIPAEEEEREWS
jgi:hypothetical protein